jgi:hypothetical protein
MLIALMVPNSGYKSNLPAALNVTDIHQPNTPEEALCAPTTRPFPLYLASSMAASHLLPTTMEFAATFHLVAASITIRTQKLIHLPAHPHPETEYMYIDTHIDVLW